MKNRDVVVCCLLFVIGLVFVSAQMNSSSYNLSSVLISGGEVDGNSSSYFSDAVVGIISGSSSSGSYDSLFGIYYGENLAPSDPVVVLNSSGVENITSETLICNAVVSDLNGGNLNVSVRWYVNDSLNFTEDYNNNYADGVAFNATLASGNTTKHQIWMCGVRTYDGSDYSDWINSSGLEILNDVPVVTLSSPGDATSTTDRTPELSWTSEDDDGDSLTYEINISHLGGIGCVDLDETHVGIAGLSYTPSPDLSCLYDNGDYYVWKVRADDGEVNGSWTGEWMINISALVDIKLLESLVSFGSMVPGDSNDTATSALVPFKVENNGTVYVNVSVNASALWDEAPSESVYYRTKVDNVSGEEGSFSWLSSITDWFDVPFTGYTVMIDYLDYSNTTDSAEIDIAVEVPVGEAPGVKSSNIVIKAEWAE